MAAALTSLAWSYRRHNPGGKEILQHMYMLDRPNKSFFLVLALLDAAVFVQLDQGPEANSISHPSIASIMHTAVHTHYESLQAVADISCSKSTLPMKRNGQRLHVAWRAIPQQTSQRRPRIGTVLECPSSIYSAILSFIVAFRVCWRPR
jgi:hypothetical protein